MAFSSEDKRNMLQTYYVCDRNAVRSSEMYFQRYPEKPQPHRTMFQRLDWNMSHYGSVAKPRIAYGNRILEYENEIVINEVCL